MLKDFHKTTFAPLLHAKFLVQLDPSESAEVELIQVTGQESNTMETFSLVFRGPADQPFRQGTYTLQHEKLGTFQLFLVPIGRDESGYSYEAVFNRLLP
jgi:hypothetical protein